MLLVRDNRGEQLTARRKAALRINLRELVMQVVSGRVTNAVGRPNPYRIGNDGVPRILPGPGGIVVSHRIGDSCVGLAGDHVEPGAAIRNDERGFVGAADGPNLSLMTSACVGNVARIAGGPCRGAKGLVTGKHGGVNHVLVDFDRRSLFNLNIGDPIQIYAYGLGLRLPDSPDIAVTNCAPGLLRRWRPTWRSGALEVRVTHIMPAAIIGSGLGQYNVCRSDFDIELFDPRVRRRFGLHALRFGDLVCVRDGDSRFGFSWRSGRVTIGVVAHSDSTVSGHGPGIVALLTGSALRIRPIIDSRANLAALYARRPLSPPLSRVPLAGRDLRRATFQREPDEYQML